jgi:7-cyano-7-deazaguanine synthase
MKSLILLSGGLDSAANLALARENGSAVALALTFDYGQRAARREAAAAQALCAYYDVPHELMSAEWLGKLGGSALTDSKMTMPKLSSDVLDDRTTTEKSAKKVWVPNRNGVLIHVAAAVAESRGIKRVLVGFNAEEAATFPDNSAEYMRQVTKALSFSTANQVEAFSYTVEMNKRQIVARLRGLSREFPFEKLWSCYFDGSLPCGECESCQRRRRATGEGG